MRQPFFIIYIYLSSLKISFPDNANILRIFRKYFVKECFNFGIIYLKKVFVFRNYIKKFKRLKLFDFKK